MEYEIIERRFKGKEKLSYDLYLLFKDNDIELGKYLLLESYLLNDSNVNLYELAYLFENTNKEIAKNIYLLDRLNNDSKEKWESMKIKMPNDSSNEYIKDYVGNKKIKKIIHKIFLFILKDKNEKSRIKKLEKLNNKYPHPDAAYELGKWYLNKNYIFDVEKYLGYAAFYKVDAALKFLEIFNSPADIQSNYHHFSMLKKYNNIKSNYEYAKIILDNKEKFDNKDIIDAKNTIYNIYDTFDAARLYLANYNLDKNKILSFFLYKTLSVKSSDIDKNLNTLTDNILKDINNIINDKLLEKGIYNNKIDNKNKIKEYYYQALDLDIDKSSSLFFKAGILGHKLSLEQAIIYYKDIDNKKYLELLLYKYIFEKTDNLYEEIINLKIDVLDFLNVYLKVNKEEKNGLETILKDKLEQDKDFKLIYNYYLITDNDSGLINKYKSYKKISKDDSILGFLIYQESLDDINATRVLIDYYLENNINFNYDIETYEELASENHQYSIKYLLEFYKEKDERSFIELAIKNIDKNLTDINNIISSSINPLILYYFILLSVEENKNVKLMEDIIYSRGQKDSEFYYLNKFYKLNSIEETEFIDYLDEYINDETSSLTTIEFLKFLKKNDETIAKKYVDVFAKNKDHQLTLEKVNDFIKDNKIKEEKKNKKIKKYTRQAKRGNQKAMLQLMKTNDKLSTSEKNELLYKACKNNNYSSIKTLVTKYGFDFIRSHNKFKSLILEASETYNDYASYIAAKVYENEEYCKEFNVEYSLEKAFYHYKKASTIEKQDIKKEVWLKLANCYELGLGTEVNLKEASKYYEPYDHKKSSQVNVKEYIESCNILTKKMFEKYPCKEYDLLCVTNKEKAEKIFKAATIWNEESLKKILKRRDYLLSLGLNIDEIYNDSGSIDENKIKDKVKMIEDNIKRIKEEKIRKEQEEKRLQEIKKAKELENKKRIEQIKKDDEKVNDNATSLNKVKSNIVKKTANDDNCSLVNELVNIKTPLFYCSISSDDKIYKELKPDLNNRIIDDEKKALASLRRYLDYPEEPDYPQEYDGFVRLSNGKRQKIYIQALEDRRKELGKYKKRLFELENPFKKYGVSTFRKKVWEIYNDKPIVSVDEFAKKIQHEFNRIFKDGIIEIKTKQYKFKDREKSILNDNIYLLERMFINSPIYAYEITLEIKMTIYDTSSGESEYLELSDKLDSLYGKTSLSRGDIYELQFENMRDEFTEALERDMARPIIEKYEKSKIVKNNLNSFVKNMFEKYNVFAGINMEINGKNQYFEGKVLSYKIEYITK